MDTTLEPTGRAPEGREPSISLEEARALAAQAIQGRLTAHGIWGLGALRVRDIVEDDDGGLDVRVQHEIDGVPVEWSEAIVHLSASGELEGVTDNLLDGVEVDPDPQVDPETAIDTALDLVGGWEAVTGEPEAHLVIARPQGRQRLVWRVELQRLDGSALTSAPVVMVDAKTGEVLATYDALRGVTGTGRSNYSGTVSIKVVQPASGSYYYLEDTTRRLATLSMLGTDDSYTSVFDKDSAFTWSWQREAVDAHYAAENMLEYLDKIHNWNGLEGSEGPGVVDSLVDEGTVVGLFVNYGDAYNGAFWYDSSAWFGDGDGVTWDPLTSLDLVGHELGHGVTSLTAAFGDSGEPAALDEGYADILAAMAERYLEGETGGTWKIGEDAYTPSTSGDAVRYLNNPAKDGVSVDHYDDYAADADPSVNAGILTLAYYLLSEGGNHPTYGGAGVADGGVGADIAQIIAFRGLKKYSTSGTDFADTRNAWLDAATDLYGADSAQYGAVMDSWGIVGVGVRTSVDTCSSYDHPFSGELVETGAKYYPSSKGQSYGAGAFGAKLDGPADADFDLFLQKKGSDGKFATVAKSKTAGSSEELLTYSGGAGAYRILVKASVGSGDFVACLEAP